MNQIWAVARHTVAEAIRMKVAVVFLLLLGLVVLGLPFSIRGDSSLTGAVQSFMMYALSATALLLSLLTVFMSRTVSDEFQNKQILLLAVKPLPRWRYIAGKWLGISLVNIVLLALSGLTMYGMVQYIRQTHPPIDDRYDRSELENQVLVARHARKVRPPDFRKEAEAELQRNLEQGIYANTPNFDPVKERERLTTKYEARWRVIGPLETRNFEFDHLLVDRAPGKEIQLRYKAQVSNYPPDEIYRALFRFGDPLKGAVAYDTPVRHVVGRYHTIRFPADAVAPDQSLSVTFFNENPFEGEKQFRNVLEIRSEDELEVLFGVGSFGGNLVRLLILMGSKLVFLAAVAVLMTTVFSFPVACLTTFTVYVLCGARGFLTDALDWVATEQTSMFASVQAFLTQVIMQAYTAIGWVLPDFSYYDAVEDFVNGRNVSLAWVLQGVSELVLVKTTVVLGVAMLLYYRREVAELSF